MATVTVLPLTLERGEYCQTHVHSVLAAEAKLVRNSFVGFFFCIVGLGSWAVDVLVILLPSRFGLCPSGVWWWWWRWCMHRTCSVLQDPLVCVWCSLCIRFILIKHFRHSFHRLHTLCWCSKQRCVFSLFCPYFTLQNFSACETEFEARVVYIRTSIK